MLSHDWNLPPNLPRCFFADLLYRTAQDTIFSKLTDATTPMQYEQAQSSLLQLKQELEKDMPPIHYAAQFGTHICLPDLFLEATIRLKNYSCCIPSNPQYLNQNPWILRKSSITLGAMSKPVWMIPTLGQIRMQKTRR
jgi:hypothetical protein